MKKYSKILSKTGLKAKAIFSNTLILFLFISCTKVSINTKNIDLPLPVDLQHDLKISIDIHQFSPENFVCDIRGNIYIIGNGRRLIRVGDNKKVEEMNIGRIYPCEIVDISTDGFDIFLLDRMNRKIWTVKRELVLDKGFILEARPLFFSTSEKGFFAVIYSDIRDISIFSGTEKIISGFLFDEGIMEGDSGSLLFKKDIIYLANTKNNRIEIFHLYNPLERLIINVNSPISLALDGKDNLFINSKNGITFISKNSKKEELISKEISGGKILIINKRLYVLNPEERRIDVFKIIYSSPDSDIPGKE